MIRVIESVANADKKVADKNAAGAFLPSLTALASHMTLSEMAKYVLVVELAEALEG